MERQRQRRANPDIRARELAAERERWTADERRRARKRETGREWNKTAKGRAQAARTRARCKADPKRLAQKRASQRAWYHKNKERICAKNREKYVPIPRTNEPWNKGMSTHDPLAYQRAYRAANREHINRMIGAWRDRNRDHVRAVGRRKAAEYAKRHPERVEEARKRYVAKAGDAYVSHWLFGLGVKECPKDLIELGRAKITLSRELRNRTK